MGDKKSFEAIMIEISGGLTGDFDIDFDYLKAQMEKYKDHELGKDYPRRWPHDL